MNKRPLLILAWLLLAAASFVITWQARQSHSEEHSSRQNEPSSPQRPSLETKLEFVWKNSGSGVTRLQELERYLETANVGQLSRLYDQLREMDDSLMTRAAMSMILEQWIRTNPDSAWSAMLRREIAASAFTAQWFHSAPPHELWQRLDKEGDTFRASQVRQAFLKKWIHIFPDEIEKLQRMTGMSDTEIHQIHFEDAQNRDDLSELLQLAQVENSAVTNFSLVTAAEHTYRDHPLSALAALSEIPARFKKEFLVETFDWCFSEKDPGPAIDFALDLDDPELKLMLLQQRFGDSNYSPYKSEILKKALERRESLGEEFIEELVYDMEYVDQEELRELLPRLNGRSRDLFLEFYGQSWAHSKLSEALEYGTTLESKYDQRLYFKSVMNERFNKSLETLETWMNQFSNEDLHHFGVSKQLIRQAGQDSVKAFDLAKRFSPSEQSAIHQEVLEDYLYHGPDQGAKLLNAHPEIITPEAVEMVYQAWHPKAPQAALEWKNSLPSL